MSFNNNDDLKKFVDILIQELELHGENSLVDELKSWQSDNFTTSSEFLGELKLILQKIDTGSLKALKGNIQQQIAECISSINKAFDIK